MALSDRRPDDKRKNATRCRIIRITAAATIWVAATPHRGVHDDDIDSRIVDGPKHAQHAVGRLMVDTDTARCEVAVTVEGAEQLDALR
jgi:hypothetical protein